MKLHNGWIKWVGLCLCLWGLPAMAAGSLGHALQQAMVTNIPDKALVCFAEEVEISILGKSFLCSNTHAVEVLRSFLETHPVLSCQILHKGKKQSAGFYIMTITSETQKQFRVYALERVEESQNLIRQFRIDEVIE